MSESAKLTSKGQIMLAVSLRNEWSPRSGDRVDFQRDGAGNDELVVDRYSLADLRGVLSSADAPGGSDIEAAFAGDLLMRDDEASESATTLTFDRKAARHAGFELLEG